jgi:hypothetical protein
MHEFESTRELTERRSEEKSVLVSVIVNLINKRNA